MYICDSYHYTIIQRMVLLDLCEMTHPVLGSEKSFDSDVLHNDVVTSWS